jgi:beta-lactamase superfamily II metal-dependent hydrolase
MGWIFMKVIFINVKKGDCILVLSDDFTCMIDTGDIGEFINIANVIDKYCIDNIDALILTHPHLDHTGAYRPLIEKIKIHNVYMPKCMIQKKDDKQFLFLEAGKEFAINDIFSMTVLAPSGKRYRDLNDYSIVIKLRYGNISFLFTGDATTLSEMEMLSRGYDLKCDVLKVGHHGKEDASSTEFLQETRPQYAIFTITDLNDIEAKVLKRFNDINSTIYFTGIDGDIEFETDGKSIFVKSGV